MKTKEDKYPGEMTTAVHQPFSCQYWTKFIAAELTLEIMSKLNRNND